MIDREDRACELKALLAVLDLICTTYDLRLGQLICLVLKNDETLRKNLFNIENTELEEAILKNLQ